MRVDAFPEGLRARLKGLPSEQPSDDGAEEFCAVRSGQGSHLEVCTGVCTGRSLVTLPARPTHAFKPNPSSHAGLNGRSWDRTSDLPRVKRALSR